MFLRSIIAALAVALPTARAAFPIVALKPVCLQQIHSPTTITSAQDGSGRLFVCDQLGKIYIIQGGMLLPTPFLNIASPSNALLTDRGPGPVIAENTGYSERGLLGLAFHPGYAIASSPGFRKFYVYYSKTYAAGTDPGPPLAGDPVDHAGVLAEYKVSATDPNLADPTSERRLMVFTEPQSNHNGGQLEFGPDGYLYFGLGDGGSQQDNNAGHTGGSTVRPTDNLGNSQDKTRIFGKILRIDPLDPDGAGPLTYDIPTDNPFFSDPTPGIRKEIYSYGMRNPWRFSFDKRPGGTDRLFCGDVGGDRVEEIDLIVSGGNYGWRYKEGTEFPSFSSGAATNPMPNPGGMIIDPIAVYAHSNLPANDPTILPKLGLSVTGGFVYRGAAIPALLGKYVFGDYGSTSTLQTWDGRLMGLEETSTGSGVFTLTQAIPLAGQSNPIVGHRILGFGEDESGEIYVGMKTKAGVLQLDGGLPSGGIYKIVPLQSYNAAVAASKDNTIFSEDVPLTRSYSDALGYLYAGRTQPNFGPYNRRALIAFDIAAQLPAGARIQSAQLQLNLDKAGPNAVGTTPLSLYRLTETWGEGTSNNPQNQGYGAPATTNDATWNYRFFNTSSWTVPGGSFSAVASASTTLGTGGLITWGPTAQLAADVQGWLDTPVSNAGWMLRGDEVNNGTASRFDSIQSGSTRPALTITYSAVAPPTHFESWLATYFPTNLVGQFVDPVADFAGDGIPNLVKYAYAVSPLVPISSGPLLQVSSAAVGANTIVTITFQRDPLATDLTYELQSSGDLSAWSTITTSVFGGVPSGSGFVSESGSPLKVVTAQETVPTPANRFVRLRVSRAP